MKPFYLILSFILGGLLVYALIDKKTRYVEKIKEIEVLKQRIDTVNKTYTVYKDRAEKIVSKYDTVYIANNFDSSDCNRLLDTCITDIYRVDSALKLCNTIKDLKNNVIYKQESLIIEQARDIKRLKFPIGVYTGVGMGLGTDGQIKPNLNISVGYKIF